MRVVVFGTYRSGSSMSLANGHAEGAAIGKDRIGFRNLLGWHGGPLDVLRYELRKADRDAEAADYEIRYESVMRRRVSQSN